ncbi:hypothetical protein AYO22_09984 [Fonsecaea multimorphosa]|nr:hypothetical protein AYO22_09984 [Fonsecaea multimorphosa]
MPLGLDDDELEASIGMYKLQLKQGPKATHSLQAQASAKDSRLRSATGPSTQRGLLHVRGEDQVEKQLQRLSAVEEETFNSHFRPPVTNSTASPWSKGNVRDPREGKTTLQYQRTPVRNPCRRRFSYADEFEKELRDMDVKHGCRPKATSTSKSSHTRTQSDLSSTSSSPPQIQKRVSFFWKLKKNVHSHGSTSSAANTEADFDAKEPATNTDVSPRHAGKRSTRFERLVKQLQGCGSDSGKGIEWLKTRNPAGSPWVLVHGQHDFNFAGLVRIGWDYSEEDGMKKQGTNPTGLVLVSPTTR